MLDWIRKSSKNTDVTMSVCTGAFVLAQTGLLSGRAATTHHGAYKTFSTEFPDIRFKRGARFTEDGNIATAGGLSSGIVSRRSTLSNDISAATPPLKRPTKWSIKARVG